MGNDINRDPEEILAYAAAIEAYYDSQQALITSTKRMVEGCLDSFDDSTKRFGDVFLEKAAYILSEIEAYKELADEMKRQAQNLIELQKSLHFN